MKRKTDIADTARAKGRSGLVIFAGLCSAMIGSGAAFAADEPTTSSEWTMGGQNLHNWRNQPSTGIDVHNVGSLHEIWEFTTGGNVSATPAVADGDVFFPDVAGNFHALAASNGALKWSEKVSNWTGVAKDYARDFPAVDGQSVILGDQAGVNAVWTGSQLVGAGARVIAVDRSSGALVWSTLVESFPAAVITSSPVVFKGTVYVGISAVGEEALAAKAGYPCCVSRGSVVALDESSGKIVWKTYTVPDNHGVVGGYSGGAVWGSTPVIDAARNSIYVGAGNNYSVPADVEACIRAHPRDKNCSSPSDYFDAVLALDLSTGAVKWDHRALVYDDWNVACISGGPGIGNCPKPAGADYDFGGAGPNFLSSGMLGAGEKSGNYWAFDPDNGGAIWKTLVGPGSALGGIEWGTAFDGTRIYVPIANGNGVPYHLKPSGIEVNSGSWGALESATGRILWQTPTPGNCSKSLPGVTRGCMALGPASSAGGVVFVGSMDTDPTNPTMFGLDGATGQILWTFAPGSSVVAAPAIVGNSVFWGSGYSIGTSNDKLFAFSINP